jgi:hypothetical protein
MRSELSATEQAQINVMVSAKGVADQDAMLATLRWRISTKEKKVRVRLLDNRRPIRTMSAATRRVAASESRHALVGFAARGQPLPVGVRLAMPGADFSRLQCAPYV